MTLKLILELLAIIPALNADAQSIITELKSDDDGEAKLRAILASAEKLAEDVRQALK